jgi:hypothetical protein
MNGAIPIHIETIGLINGCTDILSSGAFYPEQAYNNTYGIQAITEDVYEASKLDYYQEPGGCRSLTETCRALATEYDPNNYGNVPLVNEACILADNECGNFVLLPLTDTGVRASCYRAYLEDHADRVRFTAKSFRHCSVSYDNIPSAVRGWLL